MKAATRSIEEEVMAIEDNLIVIAGLVGWGKCTTALLVLLTVNTQCCTTLIQNTFTASHRPKACSEQSPVLLFKYSFSL